jgi:predicted DsbA family dithiol-disulfide isomerase
VAEEEPRALFVSPPLESVLPASSIPALTAAKCAERQGKAAFERFHRGLFVAHFHNHLDISRQDVLQRLAHDSGLDLSQFQQDYTNGEAYQAVLHDYAEGVAWFGVSALPTVVFNEKVSLVGAVPEERYRLLLDWLLAGAPGGLIALNSHTAETGATGHSPIGHQ